MDQQQINNCICDGCSYLIGGRVAMTRTQFPATASVVFYECNNCKHESGHAIIDIDGWKTKHSIDKQAIKRWIQSLAHAKSVTESQRTDGTE